MSTPRRRPRSLYVLPFALLACEGPTDVERPIGRPTVRRAMAPVEVAPGVTLREIGLSATVAAGLAINDAGVLAGLIRESDGVARVMVWSEDGGLTLPNEELAGAAVAISNSGIVGGTIVTEDGTAPFVWTSETGTTFLADGSGFGQVTTVNDDGLAGGILNDGLGLRVVLWSPDGGVEVLGPVGFNASFRHTIFVNDHGDVAFAAHDGLRVRWHDTGAEETIPGHVLSGLNDQGQVLYLEGDGGFIRERDGTAAPLVPGVSMFPVALNDLGHVIARLGGGISYLIPGCEPIPLPGHAPGAFADANGMNNRGQVVGLSATRDAEHLVVWTVDAERACRRRPVVAPLADASLILGEVFHAEGAFTDEDEGETWSALVDYGAGDGPQALPLDGMGFELSHTYAAPGSYTVAVTVTDSRDATGSAEATVEVVTLEVAIERLGAALLDIGGAGELPGWARGLLAKVDGAADHLARGNTTAAARVVGAFVRELEAHVAAGRVAGTEGAPLLAYARRIVALLEEGRS